MQAFFTLAAFSILTVLASAQIKDKTTTEDPRVLSNQLFEKSAEDPQFCEQNGNVYTPYPSLKCDWFDLRAGTGPVPLGLLQPHSQCPEGTMFSTRICTCALLDRVKCPTAPTPPPQRAESQEVIDVWCHEKGNVYTPIPRTNCALFSQAVASEGPVPNFDRYPTLGCPVPLMFNIDSCVCDYSWRTVCHNP